MKRMLKNALAKIAHPMLAKIHKLRDAHRGESCYLMGDGISVKWFDLGAFSDKTAIPCAFIPFHRDFHKLNVHYISLQEPWWFYPWERTTGASRRVISNPRQRAYRSVIVDNPDKTFLINLSNWPVLGRENIIYTFDDFYDDRLSTNFITKRINSFHGSLRFSIALAIYMGFHKVYLVGYDYTHVPSRSLHWYEKGQGIVMPMGDYNEKFFSIAREFVDITTVTLDGGARFINSISYESLTGKPPLYRENFELMDQRHLQILATWPGYSIY
jgi:hypothetical protein